MLSNAYNLASWYGFIKILQNEFLESFEKWSNIYQREKLYKEKKIPPGFRFQPGV